MRGMPTLGACLELVGVLCVLGKCVWVLRYIIWCMFRVQGGLCAHLLFLYFILCKLGYGRWCVGAEMRNVMHFLLSAVLTPS